MPFMSALPHHQTFQKKHLWIFTGIWLLVNIIQACCTELAHDEAYYWMYARKLDIGYYDHPPLIAVMIRAGGWLFSGELGVRFFTVLLSTLSIPVLYSLCGKKDFRLFVFLLLAWTSFQVYGFIAVPDSPLLFFTALFFLVYREYLANDSWKNTVVVAVVVALLLYSKYHGLLVVFFTVLSNFSLFKRKSFYAVIACVAAFYMPHILWQIANDYPSYQYHVLNKSQSYYNPLESLEFIACTIGVAGPLTGVLMIFGFIKSRGGDQTVRALRFTFIGFVAFFFLSTFNSRIEANWMAASTVPLVIVAHHYISGKETLRRWTIRLAVISLALFAFLRLNLMTDVVPAMGSRIMPEFYGWKEWAHTLQANADDCPVAIMNSYQRASKYSFYTSSEALSLDNVAYRRNQYDIWDIVDSMQGKRIVLYRTWDQSYDSVPQVETNLGKFTRQFIDNFRSFTKVNIVMDKDWYTFPRSTDVEIPLQFFTGDGLPMNTAPQAEYPISLVCSRLYFSGFDAEIHIQNLDSMNIPNGWTTVAKFRTPDKPGPYYLRFGIKTGWMPPYINSRLVRMDVE
jgi:hypothetical protein